MSWSSLHRKILPQILLWLATIDPLNACLVRNNRPSFLLTNSLGIPMSTTFAKRPATQSASSTEPSGQLPSLPAASYTLPWSALSLNMPPTTRHPLNKTLTKRFESTQRFACRVILQLCYLMMTFSRSLIYIPTLARGRDVATLCHLFKILCSSPNPCRPIPAPVCVTSSPVLLTPGTLKYKSDVHVPAAERK